MVSQESWEQQLGSVPVRKEDLDRLLMDYFVIEGHREAAETFSAETGLQPEVDLASMQARIQTGEALRRGDVVGAIESVNELNPEILDTNPLLFFHLQQQRVVELLRNQQVDEALSLASEELAPLGEEHPHLMNELEQTMALFVFAAPPAGAPEPTSAPPYVEELLRFEHRQRLAEEMNTAILSSQSRNAQPKLPQLMRMWVYGEQLLGRNGPGKTEFPRLDTDTPLRQTVPEAQ